MDAQLIINPKNLRKYNIMKYGGIQPPQSLIDSVIDKSGLKFFSRFEYVWGLPKDLLTMVKNNRRGLPAKYWHIFYDFDSVTRIYRNIKQKTKPAKSRQPILQSNKALLDEFRTR